MICPNCGKKTIENYGDTVFLTNPPIYQKKDWCGCGWSSEWREERQRSKEETLQDTWEKENN